MENSTEQATGQANGIAPEMAFPDQIQDPAIMANMGPVPMPMMPMQTIQPMSADEIALYDRQIRLWGVKAQELIRTANILLISIKALGNEIAKNLVLAGVGSLTILDHELVTEDDLGAQFLVREDNIGKNRAEAAAIELRKMNPRVNIMVDTDSVANKYMVPEYYSMYNIVIATNQNFDVASNINMTCRMFNTKFYAADTFGMYGYAFADLFIHDFIVERQQSNKATVVGTTETATCSITGVQTRTENEKVIETVSKQEMYCPLMLANSSPLQKSVLASARSKKNVTPLISALRALADFQQRSGKPIPQGRHDIEILAKVAKEKHMELQLPVETLSGAFLKSFVGNLGSELSITAAFLGGQIAQDIINVLGQREQPLQNFLFFDGEECKAPIYTLQPVFDPETLASIPMDQSFAPMPMLQMDGTTNGMNGVPQETNNVVSNQSNSTPIVPPTNGQSQPPQTQPAEAATTQDEGTEAVPAEPSAAS